MGIPCKTLTRETILAFNKEEIANSGGLFIEPDNLMNSTALDYILTALESIYFGRELYPSVVEKAAALGFQIITKHVFNDGNKRTGLQVCYVFLVLNGFKMNLEPEDRVEAFILKTADSKVTLTQFTRWVRRRVKYIEQG
jgi:death on curing protein